MVCGRKNSTNMRYRTRKINTKSTGCRPRYGVGWSYRELQLALGQEEAGLSRPPPALPADEKEKRNQRKKKIQIPPCQVRADRAGKQAPNPKGLRLVVIQTPQPTSDSWLAFPVDVPFGNLDSGFWNFYRLNLCNLWFHLSLVLRRDPHPSCR